MPTHDPYIEEACDTDGEWVADDNLCWRWVPNSRNTQGSLLPGAAGVDFASQPGLSVCDIGSVVLLKAIGKCKGSVCYRQAVDNVVRPDVLGDRLGGADNMTGKARKRLQASKMEAFRRKAQRLAIMPETGFLPRLLHEQAEVRFPMSPADYDAATVLDVDVLRFLHPHLRDLGVRFEAANHEYFVGGAKMKHSVTGLIHKFSQPFNADAVIGFMMRGRNWPRPGYLQRVIPFDAVAKLHLLCPELLPLLAGSPRDDPRICDRLRALRVFGLEDEISRLVLSPEQIQVKWAADAKEAAHYGT